MSEPPYISIVIASYNRDAPLCRTIDSIVAQGAETEIIVVDQSPRHDAATARHLNRLAAQGTIRLLRERVPNLPRARNVGVANARGQVVLFLDDDVTIPDGFLARYIHTFKSNPRLAGVCGLTMEPGQKSDSAPPLPCSRTAARDRTDLPLCNFGEVVDDPLHFVGANMAFRRDAILSVGGFNHRMTGSALGEDIEFAGRLRRAGWSTRYDPGLALWHHRAPGGGCRLGAATSLVRSRDRNRNLYFALLHGGGWRVGGANILRRWGTFLNPVKARIDSRQSPLDAAPDRSRIMSALGRVIGAVEGAALAVRERRCGGHLRHVYTRRRRRRESPTLDIIIPTYQRDEALVRTLQSLIANCRGEFRRAVVIHQGEAPSPECAQFVLQCRAEGWLIWRHEAQPGASRARNVGAAISDAEVLLFLDDDIEALPGLVAAHRAVYTSPDAAAVGGRIVWTRDEAHRTAPFPGDARRAALLDAPVCYHTTPYRHVLHAITCNFSVRRDALVMAGGFLEWFRGGGEDLEFNARLARIGRIAYCPEAVVVHHQCGTGGTRTTPGGVYTRAYQKFLAFHVSTLRAVGLLGWTMVQWRRTTRQVRAAPGKVVGTGGGRGVLLRKALEVAGSASALPVALLWWWRLRGRCGDYAATCLYERGGGR